MVVLGDGGAFYLHRPRYAFHASSQAMSLVNMLTKQSRQTTRRRIKAPSQAASSEAWRASPLLESLYGGSCGESAGPTRPSRQRWTPRRSRRSCLPMAPHHFRGSRRRQRRRQRRRPIPPIHSIRPIRTRRRPLHCTMWSRRLHSGGPHPRPRPRRRRLSCTATARRRRRCSPSSWMRRLQSWMEQMRFRARLVERGGRYDGFGRGYLCKVDCYGFVGLHRNLRYIWLRMSGPQDII